jgi:hypothetical protein
MRRKYYSMRQLRVLAAGFLALALLISAAGASAQGLSQLLGHRGLGDTYSGVEALMSAQNPAMSCCAQWNAAGPVGLIMKDLPDQPFIEGGNIKDWNPSASQFQLHPYWSANPGGGATTVGVTWLGITLTPATYYKYTVYPTGTFGRFYIRVCYGTGYSSCTSMADISMGRSYFSHTAVGGEGNGASSQGNSLPIGYIAARSNRFLEWTNNQ